MRQSYRIKAVADKPAADEFLKGLEEFFWRKLSEVVQAVLEAEVDEAVERRRYERRGAEGKPGYRDGHDRARTIFSNRGPVTIARPRVRGMAFSSAVLPKHRRRLENVDASVRGALAGRFGNTRF